MHTKTPKIKGFLQKKSNGNRFTLNLSGLPILPRYFIPREEIVNVIFFIRSKLTGNAGNPDT